MSDPVPMTLVGVRIELPSQTPILLLREAEGRRYLPIWIGDHEATAIVVALEGVESPRPMTHDLLKLVTESLDAQVSRVVVTELNGGTFYADLVFTRNGEEITVSARPSDAMALAARTEAELFAERALLDEVGVEIQDDEEEEQTIERFKEFLDDISPEDFVTGENG